MNFSKAQVFYLDPDAVGGVDGVFLKDIQLFFSNGVSHLTAPPPNLAGITNPGVTVMIAKTTSNNAPDPTNIVADSYTELFANGQLLTSNDASVASVFSFDSPIPVETGAFYAIMIQVDTPEIQLWKDVVGDFLVGTTTPSSGPSGKYTGAYYELGNDGNLVAQTSTTLKFIVDIARFTANSANVELVNADYEFINYDTISNTYIGDEHVFQDFGGYANGSLSANVTFYGAGKINVSANSNVITGTGTSFTNGTFGFVVGDQIVITDGTVGNTDIILVDSVPNDSVVIVNSTPSFTNTSVWFKKTAIATVYNTDYPNSQMIFSNSTSNSTVQFSSSSIKTLEIVAGGTGYANTDYVLVSGATINATANIGTNSTGGIVSLNIVNSGFGFTNTGVVSINAANGSASNGTTANIVAHTGATIRGELSGSFCNLASFWDYHVSSFTPEVLVKAPDVSVTNLFADFANTAHVVDLAREFEIVPDHYILSPFDTTILSRAVEINTANSNLANVGGEFKSAYIRAEISVNQSNALLFTSPYLYEESIDIMTYRNQINNSDFGETTNTGNCLSKGISISVTFANNGLANTLRLYSSIYMPIGTTVEWFAKVVNFNDPESFSSKSWTPLVLTGGVGQFSSLVDTQDFLQYTFSVPLYPKSLFTCSGVATVSNTGNTVITTSSDLSANLVSGDMIKVYSPVFSNDYFITIVSSSNSSAVVVTTGTTNNSVSGAGLVIDKIDPLYKNTAFSDPQNNGVLTYYNSGLVKFTQFSTMAFKPLLLSNSSVIVPRISDYRSRSFGIMAHNVPNTNPSANASFQDWLNNTVLMGQLLTGNVVTTAANSSGEVTTGNSVFNGVFSANVLVANVALRGGSVQNSATLPITSNVSITGQVLSLGNSTVNTIINSSSISTANIFGTVTITGINFGNSSVNAIGNSTVFELNTAASTLLLTSNSVSVGNGSVNIQITSSTINIASASINSTFYTGTANNANNFGGQNTAYWMSLISSSNNALFLGGLPANAYALLANSQTFTGNNTFNGTTITFGANVVAGTETVDILNANNINANTLTVKTITSGNISSNEIVSGVVLQTNNSTFASNTKVCTSNAQVIIDSFPKVASQCAKYLVFVYNTAALNPVHSIEIMMIHDGNTNIIKTDYAELYNTNLGTFDAAINGANVEIYFSPASANSSNTLTVKLQRTQVI